MSGEEIAKYFKNKRFEQTILAVDELLTSNPEGF